MKKSIIHLFFVSFLLSLFFQSCSNDTSVVSADKIIKQIKEGKSINYKEKRIVGNLDFTKVKKPNKNLVLSTIYVEPEIVFVNCVFEDTVTAYNSGNTKHNSAIASFSKNVIFVECEFKKLVDFTQSDFKSQFSLDMSKIEGDANFDGACFKNYASFNSLNVSGNASFVSASFYSCANFRKVLFKNKCVFQRVNLQNWAMFSDSHFYGYTEFSKLSCSSDVDFANTQFASFANLSFSTYLGSLKLANCKFSKGLTLENNTFLGNLVLQKADFSGDNTIKGNNFAFYPITESIIKSDSSKFELSGNKIVSFDTNNEIINKLN